MLNIVIRHSVQHQMNSMAFSFLNFRNSIWTHGITKMRMKLRKWCYLIILLSFQKIYNNLWDKSLNFMLKKIRLNGRSILFAYKMCKFYCSVLQSKSYQINWIFSIDVRLSNGSKSQHRTLRDARQIECDTYILLVLMLTAIIKRDSTPNSLFIRMQRWKFLEPYQSISEIHFLPQTLSRQLNHFAVAFDIFCH